MMLILWSLAFNVEARYEDVQCCSEIYVSGGYEFQEKSKTLDMKGNGLLIETHKINREFKNLTPRIRP